MLNYAGKAIPRSALITIVIGQVRGIRLADFRNISRTNVAIAADGAGDEGAHGAGVAAECGALLRDYRAAGVDGAALVGQQPRGRKKPRSQAGDWRDAFPFAAAWFIGMLLLYWCYAEVGPLLGAISAIQPGAYVDIAGDAKLVWWGHHHIEPHSGWGMFLAADGGRRSWMVGAVSLYVMWRHTVPTSGKHFAGDSQPGKA